MEINDGVSHRIGALWIWVIFGVLCDKNMPPKLTDKVRVAFVVDKIRNTRLSNVTEMIATANHSRIHKK
ncbi:hypothetical protein H5410_022789 [Solanum commersonii]|uniref:Uncharacterized protein n=1 Tax=Solanum commersonii TaxID=4109 RepID=A0A9J5ZIN3_SOLCO|nr:hypothetical protein H5410_022789 [Solanum commersonii]